MFMPFSESVLLRLPASLLPAIRPGTLADATGGTPAPQSPADREKSPEGIFVMQRQLEEFICISGSSRMRCTFIGTPSNPAVVPTVDDDVRIEQKPSHRQLCGIRDRRTFNLSSG
jgi:hypothetical protein